MFVFVVVCFVCYCFVCCCFVCFLLFVYTLLPVVCFVCLLVCFFYLYVCLSVCISLFDVRFLLLFICFLLFVYSLLICFVCLFVGMFFDLYLYLFACLLKFSTVPIFSRYFLLDFDLSTEHLPQLEKELKTDPEVIRNGVSKVQSRFDSRKYDHPILECWQSYTPAKENKTNES